MENSCYEVIFSNGRISWTRYCVSSDIKKAMEKALKAYSDNTHVVSVKHIGQAL